MNHETHVKSSALTAIACRAAFVALFALMLPPAASAQGPSAGTRTLTLADAFRFAEPASDDVRIAQNAVVRAKGQYMQARSTVLPQVTASANYQRQLQNQFNAIISRFAPPADPGAPVDTTPQPFNPISVLFASPNTITLGLQAHS